MDKIKNKIIKSINNLKPWFESCEMSMIVINGGYELTIRDRLMIHLQKEFPQKFVISEHVIKGKRCDIGIVDEPTIKGEKGIAHCIIELKINFVSQIRRIIGYKGGDIDEFKKMVESNSIDFKKGRLHNDVKKWKSEIGKTPIYHIYCLARVVDIEDGWRNDIRKYSRVEQPNKTKNNLKFLNMYFSKLQQKLDHTPTLPKFPTLTFTSQMNKPFKVKTRLNFYVITINHNL